MSGGEINLDVIRDRAEQATELWLWHEATDDIVAGYGAHMGQLLYRLPADSQTADMKTSIDALVADNAALLAEVERLRALVGDTVESCNRHRQSAVSEALAPIRALADEWRASKASGAAYYGERLSATLATPAPAPVDDREDEDSLVEVIVAALPLPGSNHLTSLGVAIIADAILAAGYVKGGQV